MGGNQRQASSRLGGVKGAAAGGGGEIVEVHGGHIVRSIGRKDRHSKVCTAKGPRDRRVRLSADTAIQFYDVQDRLGYDRPSKAVDWLIEKAKAAIDELARLPPWNPLDSTTTHSESLRHDQQLREQTLDLVAGAGSREEDGEDFGRFVENGTDGSGFLTPALDSDSIADTIISFFPKSGSGSAVTTAPPSLQFQSYPPSPGLMSSSSSSQSQDLRLSLQSFADSNLLHHHQSHHRNQNILFSGASASPGFDLSTSAAWTGWSEHPKVMGWNASGGADPTAASGCDGGGSGGDFGLSSALPPLPVLFGQSGQLRCQRGPLQSSYAPSIRAWYEPSEHQYYPSPPAMFSNESLISGMGFAPGRYSGFQTPARIRGEEEHNGGAPSKPSSVTSDSCH